jgi:hypothetical protein
LLPNGSCEGARGARSSREGAKPGPMALARVSGAAGRPVARVLPVLDRTGEGGAR